MFGDRLSGAHLLRQLIEAESENGVCNQLDLLLAKNENTQEGDDSANKMKELLSSS